MYEKNKVKIIQNNIITDKDFLKSNFGQKHRIEIIITKEKFPSLCPVERENKILIKMNMLASTLYFVSENKTKNEKAKNINPIL